MLYQQSLDPALTPHQLRDVLAGHPDRAVDIATHPSCDEALRQWIWRDADDELRFAIFQHYVQQKNRLIENGWPLPESAVQYDDNLSRISMQLSSQGEVSEQTQLVGSPLMPGGDVTLPFSPAPQLTPWLRLPDASLVELTAARVVIGRKPNNAAFPDAQCVLVVDETKLLSSSHVLLDQSETEWYVTDLGSTNGTALSHVDNAPMITAGSRYPLPDRFSLGGLQFQLFFARP